MLSGSEKGKLLYILVAKIWFGCCTQKKLTTEMFLFLLIPKNLIEYD